MAQRRSEHRGNNKQVVSGASERPEQRPRLTHGLASYLREPGHAGMAQELVRLMVQHPEKGVDELAAACGFPEAAAKSLAERFSTVRVEAREKDAEIARLKAGRRLKPEEMPDRLRQLQTWILDAITPEMLLALGERSPKDLMIMFGIASDKERLYSGQPTIIFEHQVRLSLEEEAVLLEKELLRRRAVRGPVIEGKAVEVGDA